jgi:hypothetical protein
MAYGLSLEDLRQSLSGFGSASGNLTELSITGRDSESIPLVDFSDFANHIVFGNAERRLSAALTRMYNDYPIGLSGNIVSNSGSLSAYNIFQVDKYLKESNGFDLWLLDQFGKSSTAVDAATKSVTAAATNNKGEIIPLIIVHRNNENGLIGSQTATEFSISARAESFEQENISISNSTPGTGISVAINKVGQPQGVFISYPDTIERSVNRAPNIKNMLPEILFQDDDEDNLENLMQVIAEEFDFLKLYIDQIPYLKTISYDNYNRIPDKMLPLLAEEYGIDLFESAVNKSAEGWFVDSSSGSTAKQVNFELWKRILNSVMHLLKTKGTKETLEAISRLYGVDKNFVKTDEYSIFAKGYQIRDIEEVDTSTLYSSGDVYVKTVAGNTSSSRVFDFPANQDFTIQTRVSVSSAANHVLLKHPAFTIELDASGRVSFKHSVSASLSAQTPQSNLSGFVQSKDSFFNVAAVRNGTQISVFATALSGSASGGNDVIIVSSAATSDAQIANVSFDTLGASQVTQGSSEIFPTYFPASGSFTGYMHEVRVWKNALSQLDIEEHTRNFQSISFQGSTGSSYNANWGSLSAHWKLKENVVLAGDYNFIEDSTTAGNTATPISFSSTKRYKTFPDMKKVVNWTPIGLAVDNDKIRQESSTDEIKDSGYISFHLTPVNAVNRDIKNVLQDVDLSSILGDPADLYKNRYEGEFRSLWHLISARYNTEGGTTPMVDINTFIVAMSNFNDTLGGMFPFVKQFLPARTRTLSEGVYIEPHIFERSKMKRRFGVRERDNLEYVGAPTGITEFKDSGSGVGVISFDAGGTTANLTPSIVSHQQKEITITNRYLPGAFIDQGSNSANLSALHPTASTTAYFQGYRYEGQQSFLDRALSTERSIPYVTKRSTRNTPKVSTSRSGKFLPIKKLPADPNNTEIDVTLDSLIINPIISPTAGQGFISGKVRLLSKGRAFNSKQPVLKFEFPTSSDGTNLFVAELGDLDAGQGRIIEDADNTFITDITNDDIQINLKLNRVVSTLSAVAGTVTQLMVDGSNSGSLGIVPIRITNLFNNNTQIVRVAVNSITSNNANILTELKSQGGVKVTS